MTSALRTASIALLRRCGLLLARLRPLRHEGIVLVIPYHHLGGAERVHLELAIALRDLHPLIIFTARSARPGLDKAFAEAGRCADLGRWFAMPVLWHVALGYVAGSLACRHGTTAIGSNTPVFYNLLPMLGDRVRSIDITHSFGSGLELQAAASAPLLSARVAICHGVLDALIGLYRARQLSDDLARRIRVIANCSDLEPAPPREAASTRMRILHIARKSPEKRNHLAIEIMTRLANAGCASGSLVGPFQAHEAPGLACHGALTDRQRILELYRSHDLVLLTSAWEGFPLVFQEAMSQGCVPVSTAVGGIPMELTDGVDSILTRATADTDIVDDLVGRLTALAGAPDVRLALSRNANAFAASRFSRKRFSDEWRLLLGCRTA